LFRCRGKRKVEARVVEEDGFESSADDAELPAKGLEKWIIPVEKAFNVLATVSCHWSLKSGV
jgi:hypothetical protein